MTPFLLRLKAVRFCIPVTLTFIISAPLFSQILSDPQKDREEIFTARIKQFNEFADRFNLKTDFNGNPADSSFRAKMPRERMISMLFDLKDPRIQRSGEGYSAEYMKTKELFTGDVVTKNLMLYKYSPGIIAEARSRVIYKGEPARIRIFMIQETVGRDMVKWVLYSAKGDLLNIFSTDTSMVRFIPPSSNETDFINLKRALEDTDHLPSYAHNDFEPDNLTMFFSMIRSGQLKFEYVEEVIYHVIDIPGWYLKIRDFNRTELNSGWLITDVARNNLDIADFIKNLQ
jgi:hypothetical protein